MNNPFHTDLTTNNYNSFEQINMKFTENQIYGMAMKINKLTDLELNNLPYKEALKNDKRTFCMYYLSLIRTKHLLFFSFMNVFDYNSRTLKIFLFFFNFIVNFIANAFFFNEGKISKIHSDGGSFDFIYNIPQILYSALISGFVNALIKTLALSYWIFNQMKKINNINIINITLKKYISALKLKSEIFFIFSFALLVLFWFYLACFCAVYKNRQIYLIKDTLISFGTSMIYPFGLYFFPAIFRMNALKGKN